MKILPWTALACLLVACSSQGSAPEKPTTTMHALAAELLDRAESRADLGRMVVSVHGVAEAGLDPTSSRSDSVVYYGSPPRQAIGEELERELLLSLGDRVRTLEPTWTGTALAPHDLERALAETSATHLVVGDYVQHGAVLRVSLRLIEVKTGLILATSSGVMAVEGLSDRGRQAAFAAPRAYESTVAYRAPAAALAVRGDSPPTEVQAPIRAVPREAASHAPSTSTAADLSSGEPAGVVLGSSPTSGGPAFQRSAASGTQLAPPRTPSSQVRTASRGGPAFFRWTAASGRRR